jgi:predicted nucleic acid-binding protein
MYHAYFDASALAKRYFPETGTAVVDHLFRRIPPERMVLLPVGLAEVASILVRKRNAGPLTTAQLHGALNMMRTEVGVWSYVHIPFANDRLADRAIDLIDRHSVNSTDAILLRSALDLATRYRANGLDLFLVTCDLRLIRAARAENLATFNPEAQAEADLDTILGP